MDTPRTPTLADPLEYSAVRLFVQSAQRGLRGLELQAEDLEYVAHICGLVEGMPLGILLAAGWVEVLSPAEIADEISCSVDFLETDLRDVPERQRSMRAVFDHSWNLLTKRQREVFAGLSVFRGGFTRQAAQQVTGVSLRELKGLVDRSLVHRAPTGRYEVHELLRQYAEEKLDASPTPRETAHNRHCAYYIAILEHWRIDLKSPRQRVALAELDLEIENARDAWDWALERDQVQRLGRAIEGLCHLYDWRGRWQEAEATCEAAATRLVGIACGDGPVLSKAEGLRVLARCLMWQGWFCRRFGRLGTAINLTRRSLALLESPMLADQDTRAERAFALYLLGVFTIPTSPEQAFEPLEQSAALYRALGDRWGEAHALNKVAWGTGALGAFPQAKQLTAEVLTLRRTLGDQMGIATSLFQMAIFTMHQRQPRATNREGAADCATSRLVHSVGAGPEKRLAQYERAHTLVEMSLPISREAGFPRETEICLCVLGCVALAEAIRHLGAGTGPHLQDAGKAREAYAEAQRLARESAVIAREIVTAHDLASALAVLAVAARGLGNSHQAWKHLGEGLQIYAELGFPIALIYLMPATALLLAYAREHERAVEVYALASRYPFVANSRWFEDVFGRHVDAIAATLPPEVAEAARERGRARDLHATVKELLVKLDGWQIPASDSSQKDS